MRALLFAVVAALALAGCEISDDACPGVACGPVGPPVEVTVEGLAGATVEITRQDGAPITTECGGEARTYCSVDPGATSPIGTYLIHVEATGYVPVDEQAIVDATPPGGCCNPGYVPVSVTIELTPE